MLEDGWLDLNRFPLNICGV